MAITKKKSQVTGTARPVPAEFRAEAKWLIVGEAPGEDEEREGRPFVGRSGKLLEGALAKVGLRRGQFTITNVSLYRPEDNDIDKLDKDILKAGIESLKELIRVYKPEAILCLGNTAMEALTGFRGITNRRGSIYAYEGIPLLPTLHPAAVLRDPKSITLMLKDIQRFRRMVEGKLQEATKRELVIRPDMYDYHALIHKAHDTGVVSVDIEAFGRDLACVGFAPTPDYAVCIPWDTDEHKEWIVNLLRDDKTAKVFHNSPYDVVFLKHIMGIEVGGLIEDTLAMAQAYDPEMPRDLATLTSLYTLQPYYKDLAVDWKKKAEDEATLTRLYTYNALDVSVTIEIYHALEDRLLQYKLYDVYAKTRRVLPHTYRMSSRGVLYDRLCGDQLKTKVQKEVDRWQKILNGRAGKEVNAFSSPQVSTLLYEDLRLPVKRGKTKGGVTTGEKALNTLYTSVKDRKIRQTIRALLKVREGRKFISSYLKRGPSKDGRVRTSFNPMGTETGRWSASKFLISEGYNLQTVPPAWKPCFIADEGMVLWNADYSQIEARIVAYEAQDERQMAVFDDPTGDIHRANASVIFNKPVEEIVDAERQIGKSVHAINYGVGPEELKDHINKAGDRTGVYVSLAQAARVREIYLERFPAIVKWQRTTWDVVREHRRLTNHFGRTRIFHGPTQVRHPLDVALVEHTKKEALAFVPQSDVPDMMNQALIELSENSPCEGFEVLLNVHDALMGQGPADQVDVWLPKLKAAMDIPITIHGIERHIPVDVKIGRNWKEMQKV